MPLMIRELIQAPAHWLARSENCALLRNGLLLLAVLGLTGQVLYDGHSTTLISLFPQWLLLGSIWYLWRQEAVSRDRRVGGVSALAALIPALTCLSLLTAWLGWKANEFAICGVVPISDARMYYISAQTLLREHLLDIWGQRRPINTLLTGLWLYISGDHFKVLLLIQALWFSAAVFLGSAAVAVVHGFRAGLLFFALVLVFAEPYLPSTMSETNGITCGILAFSGFLFGLHRRSLYLYCFGALFLALGLAVRPSALFVLPCVVVAGAMIFGVASRIKRLAAIVVLTSVILIPSGISLLLNRTLSHHEGAFNANLSYTVYGLVTGGRNWEQYQRDYPRTLEGLPEGEQSRVILQAARQHFARHPLDLARGLIRGLILGPLQTFFQIARLAFLGATADPLRIFPIHVTMVIAVVFGALLWCQLISRRRVASVNGDARLFCIWFLIGYVTSIAFFYKDGGLRIHAAILPFVAYALVWVVLPPGAATENDLSDHNADRLLTGSLVLGFTSLALLGWICLVHPMNHSFERIPGSASSGEDMMVLWFKPGWPQCDLRKFEATGDDKPRWFSGVFPDGTYQTEDFRGIAGRGNLYLGFDAGTRGWRAIHTEHAVGLQNKVEIESGRNGGHPDSMSRAFYAADSVQIIGAK
jgi:hypothetical protein